MTQPRPTLAFRLGLVQFTISDSRDLMTDPPATQIRSSTVDDVPSIQALIDPFVDQKKLLPRTEAEMQRLAAEGFVVISADRVVGFAAVEVYSRKMAELQCLAVDDEFQGRGLGPQLIQKCVQRARELGVHELMAITAYEKPFVQCGFDYSLPNQKKAMFIHPQD